MRLPWMSRAERRLWASARDGAELGGLMARWLEGDLASRPGYAARFGPDEETADLVPALAALCRAGWVTTMSQPGVAGPGADGLWWEQRAAVEGWLSRTDLLEPLMRAADRAGLLTSVTDHDYGVWDGPITVTRRDGHDYTTVGGWMSRRDLARQWPELHRGLVRRITGGVHLAVAAPEYGADGQRLWGVLAGAVRTEVAR